MIQVTNIKKSYGSINAVDDISFTIAKGETFGLIGPNGAGKTTTINILIGILTPDSGSLLINNDPNLNKRTLKKLIGVCPQSLAIYEELTAEENIRLFGKLYGLSGSKLKERIAFCLDLVGLDNRKSSRADTYSGGMKRRLNLACALVHDPEIILLDEPTVGVDPQSRNFIFDNIELLKKDGRTIIYTTHYMEEAERLCDRIAIIDHGKILALDTLQNLLKLHGGDSIITVQCDRTPPEISGLSAHINNNQLTVSTGEPMNVLSELTKTGITIESLNIERPNLETVFLHLTGRELRDA